MIVLALIVRRVALLGLVLFAVSILTFAIVNILPGDVAVAILGDQATPEQVAALREALGLNRPVVERYVQWIGAAMSGDLGHSMQHGQAVAPILVTRLGNSAILGLLSLAIAVPLAMLLGVIAALRVGRPLDRTVIAFSVGTHALPEYVVGMVLILLFSVLAPLLPGSSLMDPADNPLHHPRALVLPVAVMVLSMLAVLSQVTRATMIQTLRRPYIRTARLKGLGRMTVVGRHALPNALPPVVTEIGMIFGYVIGGQVVVETLFSYPGIGQMITTAVSYRDITVLQAAVLVIAVAYGIGNLAADVAATLLTPRLRT